MTSTPGAPSTWSYRPGSWLGIVGSASTLVLPAGEKARAVDLWSRIDDGGGFDAVLDALLSTGLGTLPAFALVGTDDAGTTRVLLRGSAVRAVAETADGPVEVAGTAGRTWVEQSLEGVTSLSVEVDEASTGDDSLAVPAGGDGPDELCVDGGLVRLSALTRPARRAVTPADADASEALPPPPPPAVAVPASDSDALVVDPVAGLDTPSDEVADGTDEVDGAQTLQPDAFAAPAQGPADTGEPDAPALPDSPPPPPAYPPPPPVATGWPAPPPPAADDAHDAHDAHDAADPTAADDGVPGDLPEPDGSVTDAPGSSEWDSVVVPTEQAPQDAPAADVSSPGSAVTADGADVPDTDPMSTPAPSWAAGVDLPPPADPDAPAEPAWAGEPVGSAPASSDVPAYPEPPAFPDTPAAPEASDDVTARPPAYGDHDGLTRAGAVGDEPSRPAFGIPGQAPAPGSLETPVARLQLSHGETVDVDRVVLIGRAPEARRFTTTDQPLLVTVPSPLHEISSTHVEIRPGTGVDHGSAVVTDMGSTNGTVLVQPGLGPEDLVPGIAVQLIPGATINLGDGVTIAVARP